ncbi:MAG TPA: hypothetical protein VN605_03420, partial [Thermoanaerobaculia bacterium]|nr:hypothetical protein [Thermoanaerobaculia bacterium]
MGNLTVRFIGICVHVRLQPLPVRHRVVLLAHHGGDIAGQPVDPHTPRMFLPLPRRIALDCVSVAGGTGDVYALSGVRIRVANPRGELTYHATYSDALPHLTRPGNVLQTNLPVVQEGAPP